MKVHTEVERVFAALMDQVQATWPKFHVTLYTGEEQAFKQPRQVAFAELADKGKRPVIVVSKKLDALPEGNIIGVMAHEIAHAMDMVIPKQLLDELYGPLPDTIERRADALAEAVFHCRISYDRHDVETIGPGKWPRPERLGL